MTWALGLAVGADAAAGCAGQAGVQHGGVGAPGVADGVQPLAQAGGGEPVGAVLGVEPGQERHADLRVDLGEQPDGAGEGVVQVGAQLVGQPDAVVDEVFAGAAGAAQRDGLGAVWGEWAQPGPVGAQGVGEHEGVEAIVFVTCRAVASAQVLDLVRADHHHGQPGGKQGVDDRAVGAFDGDLLGTGTGQRVDELAQPGGAVPGDLAPASVHDRHRVIIAGPVQPAGHVVGRLLGKVVLLVADFTSACSLLVPVGRRPRALVAGHGCRFAH